MKSDFSMEWKGSKQPRKQRKYMYNMPLHMRGRLLHANLSEELRKKHGIRSIRVRKGDKVKIVRGQFKGQRGNVEKVDSGRTKVTISKIEVTKKDGTKSAYPLHPSNLMIEELEMSDKKRLVKTSDKVVQTKKEEKVVVSEVKSEPVKKEEASKPKPEIKEETPKTEEKKTEAPEESPKVSQKQSQEDKK